MFFRKKNTSAGFSALRQKAQKASTALPALMLAAEKAANSAMQGVHLQRRAGPGEKFWQYREYHESDRPQDIDWRQSGRSDKVFVRQREWQNAQTTILWCSAAKSMAYSSRVDLMTKHEAAQILTLAAAMMLTRAGERVRSWDSSSAGRSELALERLGQSLCQPLDTSPLPNPTSGDVPQRCGLFQIGDFIEPLDVISKRFKALAERTRLGVVIQVLDPAEIDLPFEGRLIFEDMERQNRHAVPHAAAMRDAYHKAVLTHIDQVETLCRQAGWRYLLHRTDKSIKNTLAALHSNRIPSGGSMPSQERAATAES